MYVCKKDEQMCWLIRFHHGVHYLFATDPSEFAPTTWRVLLSENPKIPGDEQPDLKNLNVCT